MPINKNTRIAFVHIPRNGGTYIEHLMGVHTSRPDLGYGKDYNHYGDICHLFGRNMQHLTYQDMLNLLGTASIEYRWFSVIRDPDDRLISVLCHTMKCPQALDSLRALSTCILNILFSYIKFHISGFFLSLSISAKYNRIRPSNVRIQHLIKQYNYIRVKSNIAQNLNFKRPYLELYPFSSLPEISSIIPDLNIENIKGEIPNASQNKPKPRIINLFIIRFLSRVIWAKDHRLYKLVERSWKDNRNPEII